MNMIFKLIKYTDHDVFEKNQTRRVLMDSIHRKMLLIYRADFWMAVGFNRKRHIDHKISKYKF